MKVRDILRINDRDTPIAAAARLEAMMTFKKREIGHPHADLLYMEPRVVKSKEQTFNFGRIFGSTLRDLEAGLLKVPREIEEIFS
jgi:hypothetical protein